MNILLKFQFLLTFDVGLCLIKWAVVTLSVYVTQIACFFMPAGAGT